MNPGPLTERDVVCLFGQSVMTRMENYPAPGIWEDGEEFLTKEASVPINGEATYGAPERIADLWRNWSLCNQERQESMDQMCREVTGLTNQGLYDFLKEASAEGKEKARAWIKETHSTEEMRTYDPEEIGMWYARRIMDDDEDNKMDRSSFYYESMESLGESAARELQEEELNRDPQEKTREEALGAVPVSKCLSKTRAAVEDWIKENLTDEDLISMDIEKVAERYAKDAGQETSNIVKAILGEHSKKAIINREYDRKEEAGLAKKAAALSKYTTGPEALEAALSALNLDDMERQAKEDLKSGKKTKRPRAVALLNIVEGMRRNEMKPKDLLLSSVPVIPAQFRPFSAMGSTFIPGDANILYKDLFDVRDAYQEEKEVLGEKAAGKSGLSLYDAIRSVYGYGDPVKEKTKKKEIKGFLHSVVGSTAKYGYYNRKLLAKPQDNVGRSTIVIDPDLDMDHIGLPRDMAFKIYAPHIQRELVRGGMKPAQALVAVRDKEASAERVMKKLFEAKPLMYSRAPAWHRFSVLGGFPVLREGNAIAISPLVTTGLNADFDGDQQIGTVRVTMIFDRINSSVKWGDRGASLKQFVNYSVLLKLSASQCGHAK